MREDGGTFDGGAAFEVVSCAPGLRSGVVGRGVAGAVVEDAYFVTGLGGVRGRVEEGAGWVGVGGVLEDGREGEAEGGDLVGCLEGVF